MLMHSQELMLKEKRENAFQLSGSVESVPGVPGGTRRPPSYRRFIENAIIVRLSAEAV